MRYLLVLLFALACSDPSGPSRPETTPPPNWPRECRMLLVIEVPNTPYVLDVTIYMRECVRGAEYDQMIEDGWREIPL